MHYILFGQSKHIRIYIYCTPKTKTFLKHSLWKKPQQIDVVIKLFTYRLFTNNIILRAVSNGLAMAFVCNPVICWRNCVVSKILT